MFGAALLAACAKTEDAPADAASAWIEMTGVWAPAGACGDYRREWRLEAGAFHHHEMHCAVDRLELLQNGVRALAQCSVEGDDDGTEDAVKFVRRPDFTLSIIDESNDAAADHLVACHGDMIP